MSENGQSAVISPLLEPTHGDQLLYWMRQQSVLSDKRGMPALRELSVHDRPRLSHGRTGPGLRNLWFPPGLRAITGHYGHLPGFS